VKSIPERLGKLTLLANRSKVLTTFGSDFRMRTSLLAPPGSGAAGLNAGGDRTPEAMARDRRSRGALFARRS